MPEQENTDGQAPDREKKASSWMTGFEFQVGPSQSKGPEGAPRDGQDAVPQEPVQQAPAQQAPVEPAPDPQAPEQQIPTAQTPTQEPPDEQAPVEPAPGGQMPTPHVPEQQAPAAQPPEQQVPAQVAPDPQVPDQQLAGQETMGLHGVTELGLASAQGGGAEPSPLGNEEAGPVDLGGVTEVMVRKPPGSRDESTEPTLVQQRPIRPSTPASPGVPDADDGTGRTAIMAGLARPGAPTGAEPLGTISDTKLAELAVESGMASGSAVKMCADLVASGSGSPKDLAEALVSQTILTEQQIRALEQVAREGGKPNFLGAYQLLEKLGEGGMGAVFKARQVALDRLVALKILPERLSNNAEFVSRFELESRAAAKIDHPNVVRAIDAGKASGKFYFAMEFVEGASIEDILEECSVIPEEKAIGIMIQVARGMEAAWKQKLIHRDIKPDNILITEDGVAKIADLGLAREIDTVDTRLTQDGAAMGTPHYISPEQARGEDVDIRTDIYALGVTLYRMVTGEFPFSGKDPVSIIMARFHETPKAANELRDDITDELAEVIATMMAPARDLRYPDPVVLQHDLELLAQGEEPEYASSNQELRDKALTESRARSTGTTSIGLIVVKKRHRRERAFVIGGVVIALAIVASALLLGLRKGGGADPTDPRIGTSGPSEEEIAARKALEDEAAAFHEKLKALFDDEKYGEVVAEADEVGTKYAGTPHGPKVDSLRRQAADKLAEIKRREDEEAEKEKRYAELVRQARENLALKDHATATALLTRAKVIKETEEVEALFAEAKRLQYIARAEDAERLRKLEEAVDFYGLALELKDDADLRARVAELERRLAFAKKVAEGDAHVERGEWLAARDEYNGALEIAKDEERPPVEQKLKPVGTEIAYLELVRQARESAAAEKWRDVLGSATKAGAVKPDEDEPRKLILEARRAIGPEKRITNSLGMEFVLVPAGVFTMGCDTGDPDEKPCRDVRLDTYYIGVHEVTNAQYEKFRQRHQRTEYSPDDDTPVVAVSWTDAVDFCEWLSEEEEEGIECRLPTEAEWEMAARGTDGRVFPWGDQDPFATEAVRLSNVATPRQLEGWREILSVGNRATAVGSFPDGGSPFGCMDMAGNVWEWCLDWYRGDYYASGENSDPQGPPAGKHRVHRGGSFATTPGSARCANRAGHLPEFMEASVGFRVVRALDPIFLDSGPQSGTGGAGRKLPGLESGTGGAGRKLPGDGGKDEEKP